MGEAKRRRDAKLGPRETDYKREQDQFRRRTRGDWHPDVIAGKCQTSDGVVYRVDEHGTRRRTGEKGKGFSVQLCAIPGCTKPREFEGSLCEKHAKEAKETRQE